MRFSTLSIKKNETASQREKEREILGYRKVQESRKESFNRESFNEKELIKRRNVVEKLSGLWSSWLLEWKMDPMGFCFARPRKEKFRSRTRNNERRRRRGRDCARVGGPTRILILKKFRGERRREGSGLENTPPRTRFPPS